MQGRYMGHRLAVAVREEGLHLEQRRQAEQRQARARPGGHHLGEYGARGRVALHLVEDAGEI